MIKITLTKEVGYGKENICTDLFVDIAVVALFSHRNYLLKLKFWVTGQAFLLNYILRFSQQVHITL